MESAECLFSCTLTIREVGASVERYENRPKNLLNFYFPCANSGITDKSALNRYISPGNSKAMGSNNMSLHTIMQQLNDFVLNSPDNIVNDLGMMRLYDQPLVAVASAEDMLWEKLKEPEVTAPHHLSPTEWLDGARSVISCSCHPQNGFVPLIGRKVRPLSSGCMGATKEECSTMPYAASW